MILLQLYTIVFAAALAWLNRIPCDKMINYGASRKEEKEWHRVNAVVKILFPVMLILSTCPNNVFIFFRNVGTLLLILWVVFDCVLGKLLHDDWFYIGNTAKTDKLLKEVFDEQAGLMKFLIACVLILFINFYL